MQTTAEAYNLEMPLFPELHRKISWSWFLFKQTPLKIVPCPLRKVLLIEFTLDNLNKTSSYFNHLRYSDITKMYSNSYFETSNCCPSSCWRHPLRPPEARGPTGMQTKLQHWSIPRQLLVPKQISRKCFSLRRHESLQRGQKYFPVFGRGARLPLKILFLFSESATFRVCIRGRLKILLLFSFNNTFPLFICKYFSFGNTFPLFIWKYFSFPQKVQHLESAFASICRPHQPRWAGELKMYKDINFHFSFITFPFLGKWWNW